MVEDVLTAAKAWTKKEERKRYEIEKELNNRLENDSIDKYDNIGNYNIIDTYNIDTYNIGKYNIDTYNIDTYNIGAIEC